MFVPASVIELARLTERSRASAAGLLTIRAKESPKVAFNICIGNTDHHFRNHTFLLGKGGWQFSPAYDMNPTFFLLSPFSY